MTTAIPFIMNGNGTISVMIDGTMKPIDTAHKNYDAIKEALKTKNWDVIPALVNISKQVEEAIQNSKIASGKVSIRDGEVFYGTIPIQSTLAKRIVSMSAEGFDVGYMVKFLENLMKNPSYRAVNELYDFLEAGAIPITENGTFLAYKKIRNDWTDIYTGKIDNSIGAVCSMPRNMVDEDSNQTCSVGLHVCSYDYLPHFASSSNDRVVICEVNPRDVVSIPTDYNNTKMRVCEYKVIGEVVDYEQDNTLSISAVIHTDDVRSGRTAGTVKHSNNPVSYRDKQLGKEIEHQLDNGVIDGGILANALIIAGVDRVTAVEIEEIADSGKHKRAGKKVAKLAANKAIDGTTFMSIIDSELGYEEEPEICARCGAYLNDSYECPECGYWRV